ncbi:PI-PLC domain-containing protein [Bacteroides thetaiotaomicron]|nr:hypothetical protein [Bacteroides thetaiotaomicron]UYU75269.1 hypothetical protein KQP72_19630 [Bacteroides thetaiotaomicron]
MTKNLNMNSFKPKQIHFVKLPKINVKDLKFDYTIWLSQLDPNIYLSEISLPGSALSFNYLMSDTYKKTQTMELKDQFNAGVRVFQCHVNTIDQTSSIDGGSTSVGIADSDGNSVLKSDNSGSWTLGDVLIALQKEMSGTHKDEFCVLAISDWISGITTAQLSTLYSRLKVVLDKAGEMGLIATGINPNTTIGDVKGKVIIKVQLNGEYTDAWNQLSKANVWMNTYEQAAETAPYYSPMPYGAQPDKNAGGISAWALDGSGMNLIYSDCANPIERTGIVLYSYNWRDGVQANATAVLTAYAQNYESTEHRNFSMTYLGGCGGGNNRSSYTTSTVASTLNALWLNINKPTLKPWGWVMFNCVGTEATTTQGIQAVIEHNADPEFKLARRSAAKAKPSGDTKGIANGGTVF